MRGYSPLSPEPSRSLSPRLVTTGVLNLKKKPFERKRSLCCESFLAGTQVQIQNLFIITVGKWSSYCQPREHLEQVFFFSPLNMLKMFFFWQRSYAGFFSYLFALPGYTVYMSVFCLKINQPLSPPHGPRPTLALLRNGPPDKPWNFPRVIFSLSRNMCSTFQSLVIFQVTCMFFVKGILLLLLD